MFLILETYKNIFKKSLKPRTLNILHSVLQKSRLQLTKMTNSKTTEIYIKEFLKLNQ